MISKVSKDSSNIIEEKILKLKKIIPECFTENRLDVEKLQLTLGILTESRNEKYSMGWAGRNDSFKTIQLPSKNTLSPDKKTSINFENSGNIFIEGDNLEVLKLLRKSYFEKIKMVYIDPPYNTGNDFIYNDKFTNDIQSYLEQTGQTKLGIKQVTNPETSGRFHSDWISFMYVRLFLARDLLKDDGVIFVSIDDTELHNLIFILNDIFGEENQIANIVWRRKRGRDNSAKYFSKAHEYLLVYAKNKDKLKIHKLELDETTLKQYKNPDNDSRGKWRGLGIWSRGIQGGSEFEFISKSGKKFSKRLWLVNKASLEKLEQDDKLIFIGDKVYRKLFLTENQGKVPETLWDDTSNAANAADELKKIFGAQVFDTPKPIPYIRRMIEIATEDNDIILDFFAGSGSTAHALLEDNFVHSLNRKFICVQLPEPTQKNSLAFEYGFKNIAEICKHRIKFAIKETQDKLKQKKNISSKLDLGFKIFKLTKSNFNIWQNYEGTDDKKLREQMKLFESPLIEKYKEEDVIYECIIKEGFDLNSKIEKLDIKLCNIHKVSDNDLSFYICMDKLIKIDVVDKLKLTKEDTFICIDTALDDSKRINLAKQCVLKTM